MNTGNQSLQILVTSLIEQTKSRLDVVYEYVNTEPELLKNQKIRDRLYELDEVLSRVLKLNK